MIHEPNHFLECQACNQSPHANEGPKYKEEVLGLKGGEERREEERRGEEEVSYLTESSANMAAKAWHSGDQLA